MDRFPNGNLAGAAVQAKAPVKESGIWHQDQEARIGFGDAAHFCKGLRLVQKMLKRAEAGHQIEARAVEWQRLGDAVFQVRLGKPGGTSLERTG